MSESAESLAANLTSRRNVTIEITNNTASYCMIDPKIYLDGGHCHSPPQPTIRPYKNEVCNFTKSKGKTEGAAGVLTYDMFRRHSKSANLSVSIMFSVPYDYNLYKNWFGLSIHPTDVKCDEAQFKRIYYDKEQVCFVRQQATGNVLTYSSDDLQLMATMSPVGRAIMKVEIWDLAFPEPSN